MDRVFFCRYCDFSRVRRGEGKKEFWIGHDGLMNDWVGMG